MDRKIVTTNRKAFHDYTIIEKYVAGIVLTGTEIKSIRKNAVNLKDSFCKIEDNEIFLYKCHISPYEQGNRFNHDAERVRKLLLNKKEILKMQTKVKQDNYTIVPLEVFLSHGFAKVEIALAKGKRFGSTSSSTSLPHATISTFFLSAVRASLSLLAVTKSPQR